MYLYSSGELLDSEYNNTHNCCQKNCIKKCISSIKIIILIYILCENVKILEPLFSKFYSRITIPILRKQTNS